MPEQVTIARLSHRGEGLAETQRGLLSVPYTLPGEAIDVEPSDNPNRGRLLSLRVASEERIAPICPQFGECGGCALQHWSSQSYRTWKRELAIAALSNVGIEANVAELIDAHGEGRRRAILHARRTRERVEVGFSASRSHRIVQVARCPVWAGGLHDALPAAQELAELLSQDGKRLDIQVTATTCGLDIDIRGSTDASPAMVSKLARAAGRHHLARLTRETEVIVQRIAPTLQVGRATVPLPPDAFLQPTELGEAELARLVGAALKDARAVADLFCGVGPFALRLAERARIAAIDSDGAAIRAVAAAARSTSGLKPITAAVRDLYRRPLDELELASFDAVIFDPPRSGAENQARRLAKSNVPVIVAVSCNAGTFARDARILLDGGYRLLTATPVDQFRYTPHVEIVAEFRR
jgi:23S rRNA (uracil1939-C5)-methyltransferase